jgi:hypothetical protein
MSNSKSAIQEIKNLMVSFGFMKEEVTLQSFKLEDDTILQAEKLEVGNKIYKINEAFEQVALEDGSYNLEGNFEIEVSNSEISVVKEIFIDAKLKDGTVVKVLGEALVAGAKIVVVKDGMEVPAPDAVHELEDGTKVETKGGVISYVEKAGEVEEVEAQDGMEDDPSKMGYMPKMMETEVENELFSLVKDLLTKMNEKVSNLEQELSSVKNQFNSFKSEPAGKKIADGKVESFNKVENDDVLSARIAALKSLRNK